METYFNYIVESGISLGVFTLIYWLLLRKESYLKASRAYLLLAVLFSTLLPFLSVDLGVKMLPLTVTNDSDSAFMETNLLETITITASGIPAKIGKAIISVRPSVWFYGFGVLLVLFFLTIGIVQLLSTISNNKHFKLRKARLIVSNKASTPYSFFNFIFINRELPEQKNWKAIVYHEIEHVKQGHSFDVLFVDFMMVFQWFNPFYWLIRQLVRENHEFLADRAVIQRGNISTGNYKALLLGQTIGGQTIMTNNFFNVKTIQKRFKMITKKENGKYSFVKYAMGVVTALGITLCFTANTSQAEEKILNHEETNFVHSLTDKGQVEQLTEDKELKKEKKQVKTSNMVFQVVEEMPDFIGGQESRANWMRENLKYPKKAIKKGIQGKVFVSFVVEKDGGLSHAKIARGVDPILDKEAIRLVKKMPKWQPGKQNGEKVAVAYTLPVNFTLNKKIGENAPTGEAVFNVVEEIPVFIGGEESRTNWMKENLKYPEIAKEKGIQGKVYVSFVVEKDGSVGRAKVVRGVDPILDNEALRLVNNMPKWQPGKQKGENVAVSYTLPINFKLNNEVGENAQTENTVYKIVEKIPVFIGGDESRANWIKENLKYPEIAKEKGIQGIVYVSFIVEKDGSLRDAQVVRGVDPILDNEALRLVNNMPNWTPGKQKGENVAVSYTMPFDFRLTK